MQFSLLEILYYAFIFPLQCVLGFGLESLFGTIKSYGISIILLSLLVNLFLLKLSKIAESKANKTNTLKAKCDNKIVEFKRVFKGAELQSYIRTLYKQNHYHPIYALSGLGGLALQVPFFIAVLCLLKDFEGIKGVSFLWISDLSTPDAIFGIHLLPILMTIISLINVWIVANENGARIQGILIALIFLVLLYQMPSALVLYWTSNMLFSLIQAIVRKIRKPKSQTKQDLPLGKQPINLMQDIRIMEHVQSKSNNFPFLSINNNGVKELLKSKLSTFFIFHKSLKIAVILLTMILAIGLCLTFSLMIYAKDNVQTSPISFESFNNKWVEEKFELEYKARINFTKWDFLLRSSTISQVKLIDIAWGKEIDSSTIKVISNARRFVYFKATKILDLEQGANLGQISYIMKFTPLMQNLFRYYFIILGTILGIYLLLCIIWRFQTYSESYTKTYKNISLYSTLCIAFLICVFTPYQLYNTDITQFNSTQTYSTLSALFGAFILLSFIAIYVISFIPKRFSNFVAFILSVILFSGIINSFVLVGDYGLIDRFIFQKTPFINSESQLKQGVTFIIVIFCSMILTLFVYKKLFRVWQIILLTLFVVSGVNAFQIIDKRLDASKATHEFQSNDKAKYPYEDELFSYSKTDKNIVVIVLDMFSGSHMPYILEQFPYFKTQLDGFTLFNNTITTANSTIQSIATLIGGERYAIYNINKNLAQSVDKAFIDIGSAFVNNGFNVGLIAWTQDGTSNIENAIANNNVFIMDMHNSFLFTSFVNYYYDNGGVTFNSIVETNKVFIGVELAQLINFGLFKFLPEFFFRSKIYKDGNWLINVDVRNLNTLVSINYSASFYALSQIINTKSTKPTFKFFHSQMTHLPYGMYFHNNKCEFFGDKSAWNDYPHKYQMSYPDKILKSIYYQHYDTETCALKYLSNYIALLKKNGIYDNTQIYVVSDHAGQDSINMPVNNNVDVLLLFKDFGASGTLHADSRLMANYDIASIFCENLLNGCPNVPPNILKNYPNNREVIHVLTHFNKNHAMYLIKKTYKVKNNIYDDKNWTDVSDQNIIPQIQKK